MVYLADWRKGQGQTAVEQRAAASVKNPGLSVGDKTIQNLEVPDTVVFSPHQLISTGPQNVHKKAWGSGAQAKHPAYRPMG